jgi:hypothetical protein
MTMAKQFAGNVMINGSQRQLRVESYPMGRTVVQVDGATTYDKKPFVQKETLEFDILPNKKASLRIQQISINGAECDITVDGRTTPLTAVAKDGTVRKPVGEAHRNLFRGRVAGAFMAGAGVMLLMRSYDSLQRSGTYYNSLTCVPLLVAGGIIAMIKPDIGEPPTPAKIKVIVALCVVLLLAGWFFKNWFVGTVGPQ